MEELILLGTGNATVTRCYNTCFAVRKGEEYLLVDTGGGNGILAQLEKANIPLEAIHEMFISHEHTDHLLGIIWLIRMIATKMKKGKYNGDLRIYCHAELIEIILTIVRLTVQDKFVAMIGKRIFFVPISHGEEGRLLGNPVVFFDTNSVKAKQSAFTMTLESGKRLCFLGDEPYREEERAFIEGVDWLLHEAFCLYAQRAQYEPYEKCHATVKEACEAGAKLGVKNLLLYHTEDSDLANRKAVYTAEGRAYFDGMIYVPEDLERIEL